MRRPEQEKPVAERTKSRIPEFKTIEEEAEFWDTHSTTEFEDEFERLRGEAEAEGTAPDTLALLWIMERLVQARRS